ncbi:tetratricopeptide repeat protein [Dokdonella sp.]|uniref:tetratricopeptide repeat protein n=1 Tax=Dokdonella sp. TaxID=2291710 RepID=UPI0031C0FBE9|nr:tetratricopeptide repeat protein [Dokdonella sp.]
MPSEQPGFLAELKRRHVGRVALAYMVAGWLVIQIATQVFPFFEIPNWAVRLVILLLFLGFPVAVALAWIYELTPGGIRRTAPADSPEARPAEQRRQVARKLNTAIITILVASVLFLGWRLLVVDRSAPQSDASLGGVPAGQTEATWPMPAPIAAPLPAPAKSIAVLPFENLSDEKAGEYFVAGMQDLILTKLSEIADLKVISRTSSSRYRSRPDDLRRVGAELGVATVLEGSVQRAGNRVLVNVQLIDTRSDAHLWAQSYERTLDNVFGVEGEVAGKIASALDARLSQAETVGLAMVSTTDKVAMDRFLHAEFKLAKGFSNYDTAPLRESLPLYRQAILEDPEFALAYARLSFAESLLGWFGGGGGDVPELIERADADARQALRLAPDDSPALVAMAYSAYYGRGDYTAALEFFARALRARPNDPVALSGRAYVERRQGRYDAALASLQKSLAIDPRNSALAAELASTYAMVRHYAEAQGWSQRALALDPDNLNARAFLSLAILHGDGDIAGALSAVSGDWPMMKLMRVNLLSLQRRHAEALALLESVPDTPDNFGAPAPKSLQEAELYRLLGDNDHAVMAYQVARPAVQGRLSGKRGFAGLVQLESARVELGLGRLQDALDQTELALAQTIRSGDHVFLPQVMRGAAALYAQAGRAELAVPLIDKLIEMPGAGLTCAPVLLWLDPAWDPIRADPGFQALLGKYARSRPEVPNEAAATHI